MHHSLELPQYLELVGSSISLVFNVFLMYLIYRFSRPEYGSYRLLMMIMTFLYVVYSAIEVVVLPSYYIYEYNYFLFTTNFTEYQQMSQILIAVFCSTFACMQVVLASQFIYRYFSVASFSYLRNKYFHGKRHIVWISATFLFFLNWFLVATLVFSNNGDHPKELEEAVKQRFGRNISEMAFTLVTYAQLNEEGKVELKLLDIFMILYLIMCATVPMTISLICGVKTWLQIHHAALSVQKSFRLQKQERQLFIALLFQFTVPFLGNTLPMLILFICPALHVSTEPVTNYICMLIPFYPIFDATATIFIIRDYYRGVLKIIGCSSYVQNSSSALDGAQVPPNTLFTQSSGNPVEFEMMQIST